MKSLSDSWLDHDRAVEISIIQISQNAPLVLIWITPVRSTASHKQKKLTTTPNKPRVKKLSGKVKNCKTGRKKKLIKAKTKRKIPKGKNSPTAIWGTSSDKIFIDKNESNQEIIILNIVILF